MLIAGGGPGLQMAGAVKLALGGADTLDGVLTGAALAVSLLQVAACVMHASLLAYSLWA